MERVNIKIMHCTLISGLYIRQHTHTCSAIISTAVQRPLSTTLHGRSAQRRALKMSAITPISTNVPHSDTNTMNT